MRTAAFPWDPTSRAIGMATRFAMNPIVISATTGAIGEAMTRSCSTAGLTKLARPLAPHTGRLDDAEIRALWETSETDLAAVSTPALAFRLVSGDGCIFALCEAPCEG